MTETAFYILLSLTEARHGYGIMQHVDGLTAGRVRVGAGTLYGTLPKLEREGLIEAMAEEERRKIYRITTQGRSVLEDEITRLEQLVWDSRRVMGRELQ